MLVVLIQKFVFADDAKFFRHILTLDDSKHLQNALDVLQNWSKMAVT